MGDEHTARVLWNRRPMQVVGASGGGGVCGGGFVGGGGG